MMGTLFPVDATRYVKRTNSTPSGRTDSEGGIGGKLRSPAFGGNCFEFRGDTEYYQSLGIPSIRPR